MSIFFVINTKLTTLMYVKLVLAMWCPQWRTVLDVQALWHHDVCSRSDQRLVDSKGKGGSACITPPFQGFMEISVTSEGSQSRQWRAARKAAPTNILEGEKYYKQKTSQHNIKKWQLCLCVLLPRL